MVDSGTTDEDETDATDNVDAVMDTASPDDDDLLDAAADFDDGGTAFPC